MERFAATILFLFALLSGGGAAAASDGCESPMRGAAKQLAAAAAACTTATTHCKPPRFRGSDGVKTTSRFKHAEIKLSAQS
jgi:hypothetical protein